MEKKKMMNYMTTKPVVRHPKGKVKFDEIKNKNKTEYSVSYKRHHPRTIDEAINDLQTFFESDMWYSKDAEWKTEKDMERYLTIHFNILREEIIHILEKKKKLQQPFLDLDREVKILKEKYLKYGILEGLEDKK